MSVVDSLSLCADVVGLYVNDGFILLKLVSSMSISSSVEVVVVDVDHGFLQLHPDDGDVLVDCPQFPGCQFP